MGRQPGHRPVRAGTSKSRGPFSAQLSRPLILVDVTFVGGSRDNRTDVRKGADVFVV